MGRGDAFDNADPDGVDMEFISDVLAETSLRTMGPKTPHCSVNTSRESNSVQFQDRYQRGRLHLRSFRGGVHS